MKISEVLKDYADFLSEYHSDEYYEVILCNDIYGIALTFSKNSRGQSGYFVYTLVPLPDKPYNKKIVGCYTDKETAENAYKLLIKFSEIHCQGGEEI